MYGIYNATTYENTHKNTYNSNLKSTIDTWYVNNLSSYVNYLADAGFCNERNVHEGTGIQKVSTVYAAEYRLMEENKPQFKCIQSNDLFTTSASSKGNKSLNYPIGTITADELFYAGAWNYKKILIIIYIMHQL